VAAWRANGGCPAVALREGLERDLEGLVIVRDFDIVGMTILPPEANTEPVVDPDAHLASPVTPESFKSVSRRCDQVHDRGGVVELIKLSVRDRPELLGATLSGRWSIDAVEDVLRRSVAEAPYHVSRYTR
jgi:hypothetical protein